MKIKLMIIEPDKGYLDKLHNVFVTKYADRLTVYSFSDEEVAKKEAESLGVEVVVADVACGLKSSDFAEAGFALLTDNPGVTNIDGVKAINKFQKADMIYKGILDLYADSHANIMQRANVSGGCKVILFASPAGGTGSSCAAAATALRLAKNGASPLYLNLEKFGVSDSFFSGEGFFTFSDIIYALKSKKVNLAMKLESTVKKDNSGVSFFSGAGNAMDMQELSMDETIELINTLVGSGKYSHICIDADYTYNKEFTKLLKLVDKIVETSDGTENSNVKIARAYEVIKVFENTSGISVADRICVMYNKFSNKLSKELANAEIKSIGGAPRYEHATNAEVISELSKLSVFDSLK